MKTTNRFFEDVLTGLNSKPKRLHSKYFYDAIGDEIFREIMNCTEYYPTRCEMEVFTEQKSGLVNTFNTSLKEYDVVELGAGDASKSVHLLQELMSGQVDFTYYPIDISKNVISFLEKNLPKQLPGIKIKGLNGEYFEMLEQANKLSAKNKIVMFLGSNIGNIQLDEAGAFCTALRAHLKPGDLVLIGFDLKKTPKVILNAYNDKQGITRRFNLNLLRRINDELGADFQIDQFEHYPVYDPSTGACKSYLVSLAKQKVCIGDTEIIEFDKNEAIFMEISQKYTVSQTDNLAKTSGFTPVKHFYDSRKWFLDTVWQCV